MSFRGRHRRKWLFVLIGTILLLGIERFSPWDYWAPRTVPSAAKTPSLVGPAERAADLTTLAPAIAAISPDVGSAHPYPELPPPVAPAWKAHAVPVKIPPGLKPVAIVIDDVGIDRLRSERAIALPAPLTLALLPYARDVRTMARKARAAGHETLVHMPMEPKGMAVDPGPVTLTARLSPADFQKILAHNLDAMEGYVGINNHMGSRMTEDRAAMTRVMDVLSARGLMFLDSRTTAQSVGAQVAAEQGVPHLSRDVFLDNDPSPQALSAALRQVEEVAQRKGSAVAIGHPKDATLAALAEWLPTLAHKGLVAVPVSALLSGPGEGGLRQVTYAPSAPHPQPRE